MKKSDENNEACADHASSGAIAQNGSTAADEGGVAVAGDVHGDVCTHSGHGNMTIARGDRSIGQLNSYGIPHEVFAELAGKHEVMRVALNNFLKTILDEEQNVPLGDLDSRLRDIAARYKELVHNLETTNSADLLAKYARELKVTELAISSFFKILEQHQVPRSDLDSKLREIAAQYKELLARLETVQSEDPQVVQLKEEARQAIVTGDYTRAEDLLNQAEARDMQAIEEFTRQRCVSAAASCAENARLQRIQLRYAEAAEYWQKAVALLPQESRKERSLYLHEAGYNLKRIARYSEALPLYEQSLVIRREIGDRAGEGATLNNISQIYDARGDYDTALKYVEESLIIRREIGDRAGEGITLNNISQIYDARGDYATALKYLEQSLSIYQEISDRAGESITLNNIGQIYRARGDYSQSLNYLKQSLAISREIGDQAGEGVMLSNLGQIYDVWGDYEQALALYEQSLAISKEIGDRAGEGTTLNNLATTAYAKGDYATALTYLEQSLNIRREIGDRAGEAVTSWNIGRIYQDRGTLRKAEQYISCAVQLAEEIGHPDLEEWRKDLEEVRRM